MAKISKIDVSLSWKYPARGDILNLNLTDLASSLKFPIIWDVLSGEKIKFDVALWEHEAQGTLFFTK